ncbi:LPXTG-motif cell wall anchor domain-containing protein [Natronincola ferrireducens]|uniref:LPXTG-motif cell wall anchor domain-containing protein n=1 Tax=Natronincola ferrireducens TaxID=393762 RepID=A0A1G8Y7C6_9FIRM|nr:LPXTG-motif cell wall anchor domain-containing protein [Natronincola ferrireducens]
MVFFVLLTFIFSLIVPSGQMNVAAEGNLKTVSSTVTQSVYHDPNDDTDEEQDITLHVTYDRGDPTVTVIREHPSRALHFDVERSGGLVQSAVVKLPNGEIIKEWTGQGGEKNNLIDCEMAYWHWIYTPSGVLTISSSACRCPREKNRTLVVKKVVERNESQEEPKAFSDPLLPMDKFEINITGPDGYNHSIFLGDNESKTIENLKEGYYTITEKIKGLEELGYELVRISSSCGAESSTETLTVYVEPHQKAPVTVTVINKKIDPLPPPPDTLILKVKKVVVNSPDNPPENYKVKIYKYDEDTGEKGEKATEFTISPDQEIILSQPQEIGTYIIIEEKPTHERFSSVSYAVEYKDLEENGTTPMRGTILESNEGKVFEIRGDIETIITITNTFSTPPTKPENGNGGDNENGNGGDNENDGDNGNGSIRDPDPKPKEPTVEIEEDIPHEEEEPVIEVIEEPEEPQDPEEEIILEEEVPVGIPQLPKTGEGNPIGLYLLGGLLTIIGIKLRRAC